MLIFHKISGVIIIIVYGYIFTNIEVYYPSLQAAWAVSHARSVVGVGFVMLLPFVVSILFIFPRFFSEKFSPKIGIPQRRFLGRSALFL